MEKYVMALDQGTTSSRCILYDKEGKIVSGAQKEFKQIYPQTGWVEHDPMEIWSTQMGVVQEAILKIDATYKNIDTIGITNQRETTVVWEKSTGKPICNAIVWQCRRTASYCDKLRANGFTDMIREKTGLLLDAYFSATKLAWILDNVDGAREKAEAGDLLFGTVETWLIWKLTGDKLHITDYSNASRTMLFNINTLTWDEELLELFQIPRSMLPEVHPSSEIYGISDPKLFGGEITISGIAGDQQAALFGQTCFKPGEGKNTFGTGCFMLMNTGEKPVFSQNGLLTTIAWVIDGKVTYALEGSIFVAGAAIQWLRDELGILEKASDSERMAKAVEDSNGVYIVPAFVGLGAPHWDPYARGAMFGLTRGANRNHVVRATLESLAYQTYDLLQVMAKDTGIETPLLKVDGGASTNNFLLQFLADVLDKEVQRPRCVETTSLGAAYLAGLATGYWKDKEDIIENCHIDRIFKPDIKDYKRKEILDGWESAVKATLSWSK
ncbi:MAG: glycerol kinase GlpK [Anaerovoracaceae bacterium]